MTAILLSKQDINIIHSLDFKSYVHSFDTPIMDSTGNEKLVTWTKLAAKGTAISTTAIVDKIRVGFAVWERGARGKPGSIIRLGVIPEYRRDGVGTSIIGWVADDMRANGKNDMRIVLSQVTCLGCNDPDDVSGFMSKVGFQWVGTIDACFYQYGRQEDGLIFERKL